MGPLLSSKTPLACVAWLVLTAGNAMAAAVSFDDPSALCVMTYNLRYASDAPPNAWPDRRPLVKECIQLVRPDIIGTQEGLYSQINDIAVDLADYEWIGLGRKGGSNGEFMAVFFLRDRFQALGYDHFWLSDTPDVIASATWGNRHPRMVTTVHFRDKRSGFEFLFWNTHFDHESQVARKNSAELVVARLDAMNEDLPVVLAGDFNATAGKNPVHKILTVRGGLMDTWDEAFVRIGENLNTFNGFQPGPHSDSIRIDWILTRGFGQTIKARIVDFDRDGQYPSDHFPVVAWISLPPK